MSALRGRLNAPAVALAVLFVVGIALRAYLMLRWRPGFLGYPDSRIYLQSVHFGPYYGPFWPGGYARFLAASHWVTHELAFAVLLQHGMGVAAAALLYGAARRLGASVWVAAVPAAVVLLGGAQIMFEHAILSEPLWGFLVAGAVYLTARALSAAGRERTICAAAAGLVLGLSMVVRVDGLFLVPPLALALLAYAGGPWWARLRVFAAAAVACLAVVAFFQVVHHHATGRWGLTTNGALNFYARVAPWADCAKFDPPAGTRWLCERKPPRLREGHQVYVFRDDTPAVHRYHLVNGGGVLPAEGAREVTRFARAAVLGQPGTYLHAVGRELVRIVDPSFSSGLYGRDGVGWGNTPALYVFLFEDDPANLHQLDILARDWRGTALVRNDVGVVNWLERATRPPPWLMVAVILLALCAPLAARPERRRAAVVFALLALSLLVMPVAVALYDWRHVAQSLPYLAAAAALGAQGIAARAASRFRPASGDPT